MADNSLSLRLLTSILSKTYVPSVGLSNAPIIFISVLFPDPDAPTIDTNSPCFTLISIPFNIFNSFGVPI